MIQNKYKAKKGAVYKAFLFLLVAQEAIKLIKTVIKQFCNRLLSSVIRLNGVYKTIFTEFFISIIIKSQFKLDTYPSVAGRLFYNKTKLLFESVLKSYL